MPILFTESLPSLLGLFWLLLPVAAASGWWLAKRNSTDAGPSTRSDRSDYFQGLNYLLDDKPDQALEVFARIAELDRTTAETQLMLGNLFRRRGEVDRAIHIHHGLTVRKDLTADQRRQATLELAEDYLRAGLFDRAETLYRTLIEQPGCGEYGAIALNRIIRIYELEKDWRQAIAHCDLLERTTGQVRKTEAAHYCCELAQECLHRSQDTQALVHLDEALRRDANCVRASILQARIAIDNADHHQAIRSLNRVERQNPVFLSEVLELLEQCHRACRQPAAYTDWLLAVHERHRYGWLTASLAVHIARCENSDAALDFLRHELGRQPTFIGLRTLLELKLDDADTDHNELKTLYQTSRRMLDGAVRYRCDHCGFTVKSLLWQCPSCKNWETVRPLPDLVCRDGV